MSDEEQILDDLHTRMKVMKNYIEDIEILIVEAKAKIALRQVEKGLQQIVDYTNGDVVGFRITTVYKKE